MVPLYNSYWDPFFTPGAQGPYGYRAFDGTPEDATHMVINPDDIVAGDTIEVDFVFAAEPGAAPEALGPRPERKVRLEKAPVVEPGEPITTAWLYLYDGDYWPQNTGLTPNDNTITTNAVITGPGYYTVSLEAKYVDYDPATNGINGLTNLWLVFENGGELLPSWKYRVHVTEVLLDGKPLERLGNVGYGQTYYESWDNAFQASDSYAPIYDGADLGGHMFTWNGAPGTAQLIDPAEFVGGERIVVTFFVTDEVGVAPEQAEEKEPVWYPRNTAGLAGLSLKDLGMGSDWHNIVPVDVSKTGWQVFDLVAADERMVGYAFVAVNNGNITVEFQYANGHVYEQSQCIKWFTSLDQITAAALADHTNGLTSADVVNVDEDLGGADVVFLSINNKINWRDPVNAAGDKLVRYWRNTPEWKAWRAQLMDMINAAE
jgi:hypothetical protein